MLLTGTSLISRRCLLCQKHSASSLRQLEGSSCSGLISGGAASPVLKTPTALRVPTVVQWVKDPPCLCGGAGRYLDWHSSLSIRHCRKLGHTSKPWELLYATGWLKMEKKKKNTPWSGGKMGLGDWRMQRTEIHTPLEFPLRHNSISCVLGALG